MFSSIFFLLSFSIGHFNLFSGKHFSHAGEMFNFILFKKVLYPVAHPGGNLTASFDHCLKISAYFSVNLHAVICSMVHIIKNLGTLQQCLGGDAAPIQANAAQFGFLYHSRFQSELAGPDGSNITSRATAYNDKIIIHMQVILK